MSGWIQAAMQQNTINAIYHFLAGEVITFRFDSFIPEENYTNNATIQLHPENNELVDDIKNAIMDMIDFQIEKDKNDDVKIQVRNIWVFSPLVPSKREKNVLVFLGYVKKT